MLHHSNIAATFSTITENIALLQRTLFAISASLEAVATRKTAIVDEQVSPTTIGSDIDGLTPVAASTESCPHPSLRGSTARGSCDIHSALLPEQSRGCAFAARFVDRGSFDTGRCPRYAQNTTGGSCSWFCLSEPFYEGLSLCDRNNSRALVAKCSLRNRSCRLMLGRLIAFSGKTR